MSESLTRAPELVRGEVSLVKDVVFPLEILAWVNAGRALAGTLPRLGVYAIASLIVLGLPPWTVLLLPVVWLPLFLMLVAGGWFLSAAGVYVRELKEIVPVLTMALLFVSAVFFPFSTVPEAYQPYMLLNPLAFTIVETRAVLLWGELPSWSGLGAFVLADALLLWLGLRWFQRFRGRFAGVV